MKAPPWSATLLFLWKLIPLMSLSHSLLLLVRNEGIKPSQLMQSMEDLVTIVCPNSPYVWDGRGFSECFGDLVFVFGANLATLTMIIIFAMTTKNHRKNQRVSLTKRIVLDFVPTIGASLSFFEIILLMKTELDENHIVLYKWLASCSECVMWTSIIIFSRCAGDHSTICTGTLGFWWILKSILGIIHLLTLSSSLEVYMRAKEIFSVILNIIFCISINFIRTKKSSSKTGLSEEPLLSEEEDLEEGCHGRPKGVTCSFWDHMMFNSMTRVMKLGITKQLDSEDLLQLPNDMDVCFCLDIMSHCWESQIRENNGGPSLFKSICCAYGWPYLCLGFLKVINDCLGFAGPLLLNKLIQFLQQGSGDWHGYILAVLLGLISITKSFLDTQYTFHLSKLKLKLRSSITTLIYQKCLSVSLAERSKFSDGEIQTFMSVDAERTVNLCNSFHDMWSLPLQISVALYLLYTQVKFAFVSGIAITILLIPVNRWIAKLIAGATEKMMKEKDERIRKTGELLSFIRTIKMYVWEVIFSSWLMETRSSEVKHLAMRKYLDAWCVFFWATTPTLFSLFTFGLFALSGHQLDAATVFTCLALFNTLISPLNSFPWVINGLIDAMISTRRLSRFLSCPVLREIANSHLTLSLTGQPLWRKDVAVSFDDACCSWANSEEKEQNLVLNHVNLGLPRGSFIAVIGEVGSGKSSLLNSILGEMRIVHGSIIKDGTIAYAPQVPWILSGTIRENVLFGKCYDPNRYLDTLGACALDIDISMMIGGDMTYIGEKGVNLSGGQKARLALARAMYCSADIILLDDILSAVDAQVASWILQNAILGPLMLGKTRILCTHNIQGISSADMIVVMDKGCVKWQGSSADFQMSSYTVHSPLNEIDTTICNPEEARSSEVKPVSIEGDDSYSLKEAEQITEIEKRKEGKVEYRVYKEYAMFSGWVITVVIFLSAILMQASKNGNDLWLSYWVDTSTGSSHNSTSFYLVVLSFFCILNSSLTLVRAFSFAFGGLQAAKKVHNSLLSVLMNAPVRFFDQTPVGRILNRLSSDLYTIDDSLPFILNILLANFVGLLGIAIVLSYTQVFFLLLLLPVWYIYTKIQIFYRSTSRELRRLDSVSRSPIYSSFTETLDGSSTLRAFMSEDLFFARFVEHLKLFQQTSYTEVNASLWLSLRLQLLAAFVVSFIALMAVIGSQEKLPVRFGTPGLVGLALSYAAPIVSLLGSFLTSFTETEKEMVAIERALEYMDIPQEELIGPQSLSSDWPNNGIVEFQNVTMKYLPSLPAALCDITFTIEGGMQVGIIGRTGAGKSSVLNALFRLTPICAGSILVDDINIANVPVRDIRARFAVVPQSPFLFEGTIRQNLDPLQTSNDLKIWKTLEQCHVKEEVEAAGGLDAKIKESSLSFSVGQRQLLCLARALLKSSRVLCLDECTANIDTQTAAMLQKTISSECRGMTVITIAHRISTVLNMDRILILDLGNLVEQGNPKSLLQDDHSVFSRFVKASTM